MPTAIQILIGQKFGRLTVVTEDHKDGRIKWRCLCACGTECITLASRLQRGITKSCGCYRKEMTGPRVQTHGMTFTPIYKIWVGMKNRCSNKHDKSYARYGALGITVCKRWQKFEYFYADMGAPAPGLSIERRNGKLGYMKSNCYWATKQEQTWNRSNTIWISFAGRKMPRNVWAKELGMADATLQSRINRMPLKQALVRRK